MEDSKIFKTIWRFNAVVIAIAGVLAAIALTASLYFIFKEVSRDRHRNEIVNIDPETNVEEVFRLGQIINVKGSRSVIVPLFSDQEFSLKYSGSKSTVSTRNLLFTDLRNENSHWLLPSNKYLIANHRLINESNSFDRTKDVITILYQIVASDTNSDSRLTINDQLTIAFSKPDGTNYTVVLNDVDELLGYEILDKQSIAVMYYLNNLGYTAYIDLKSFAVVKKIELPNFN